MAFMKPRTRGYTNLDWLLAKRISSKAAPKDCESKKLKKKSDYRPKNIFSRVYHAAASLLLQPHLAPAATS